MIPPGTHAYNNKPMTDLTTQSTCPSPTGSPTVMSDRKRQWLAGIALILVTLGVYLPVLHCGYIWDDDYYVTNNPTLSDGHGLVRIWTEPGAVPQYYPLVHTVFWVQHQLVGNSPMSYHIVNVLCHILVSLLWWRLLRRLSIPGAWLAAMVFAIHPIQVESVAWVTELKNVLSGVFYLLAAIAYLRFAGVDKNEDETSTLQPRSRQWLWYALTLLSFTCGLLSKTVVCTLPCALLLVMIWHPRNPRHPRNPQKSHIPRIPWNDIACLTPLLVLGLVMGLHTAAMERHHVGAEGIDWAFGFADRLLIAGRVLWFYVGKLLWPIKLVFFYDYWPIDPGQWWQWLFPASFLLLLYGLWRNRRVWSGAPLVAVLFYAGTLFPALGFINVFPMRYAFVADHFQYLAGMGIIALFCSVFWIALKRVPKLRMTLAVVILTGLGLRTAWYIPVFTNQTTLWQYVITHNHAPWMALNNLGVIYQKKHENAKAQVCFRRAIVLRPREWNTYNNLGILYRDMGQYERAAILLQRALPLETRSVTLYATLARVREKQGHIDQAMRLLEQAVARRPDHASLWLNLGIMQLQQNDIPAARNSLQQALHLAPQSDKAWLALAHTYEEQKRFGDAVNCYRQSLKQNPDNAPMLNHMALALMQDNRPQQAINAWLQAVRLQPGQEQYAMNLGAAYLKTRQWSEARRWLVRAQQQAPRRHAVLRNLAICLLNDPSTKLPDWEQAYNLTTILVTPLSEATVNDMQLHATACQATSHYQQAVNTLDKAIAKLTADHTSASAKLNALRKQRIQCASHLTPQHP